MMTRGYHHFRNPLYHKHALGQSLLQGLPGAAPRPFPRARDAPTACHLPTWTSSCDGPVRRCGSLGWVPSMGVHQDRWFIMENFAKLDDLWQTSICASKAFHPHELVRNVRRMQMFQDSIWFESLPVGVRRRLKLDRFCLLGCVRHVLVGCQRSRSGMGLPSRVDRGSELRRGG